ncbi:DUF7159 family protein [Mycolicibacterium sp.]|uniref:DUF7159 family protein n=1 Tax=Mycolicibacterium sp. TaxID=2320850 RepID=UPI003D0EF0EA
MDLVLGLSMTSSSVRWVLVEGTTGVGDPLERGSMPVGDGFDADALLAALLDKAGSRRVHAIGLSWSADAERTASAVWQALTDRHVENVIAVSDVEAAEALACGIAEIAGEGRVVVCVVEPAASVVAAVTPDGVIADRVDTAAVGDVGGLEPDAVIVVGSGDVAGVVAEVRARIDVPVVSADEADLALARGAALASASAVSLLDAQAEPARREFSPTATLASVLAAAVVTFVVSLSAALGLTFTPDTPAPQMARSVQEPVREASAPTPTKAAPVESEPPAVPAQAAPPEPPAAPPAPEVAPVAETIAVAAVPAPEAPPAPLPEAPPVYEEPLAPAPEAYIPPAPAYVPPAPPPNYLPPAPAAPPAFVPPAAPPAQIIPPQNSYPQPQPRLRDRIIERIPIINRFHEPEYTYGR